MKPIRRIVVATDFSDCSAAAARTAAELAEKLGAGIEVVTVLENTVPFTEATGWMVLPAVAEEIRAAADEKLAEFAERHFAGMEGVYRQVREGRPYEQIIKAAEDADADLIVVGTHGRTGLSHLLLGSEAEKVVRHSPLPVLTVKPAAVAEPARAEVNGARRPEPVLS
jgi:nucleotide-binding universal stress UspA family protein